MMDFPCHAAGHSCQGASCEHPPNSIPHPKSNSQAPDSATCTMNNPEVFSVAAHTTSKIQCSCTSYQKNPNLNPDPNMVENVHLDVTPHVRFDFSIRGSEPLYRSLLFGSSQSPLQGCRRHRAVEPGMPASCSHTRDDMNSCRCAYPSIEKPSSCPRLTSVQNSNQTLSNGVMLHNWYLIKPHGFCNSEIAVGGFLSSRALDQERFITEAIIKRLEERKLMAKDGTIVNLIGTMDGCSTLSNGFSIQMVHLFLSGFPHIWNLLVGIEIPGNDSGMTSSTLMSQIRLGGKGDTICKNLFFECKEYVSFPDDHSPKAEGDGKTQSDAPEQMNQEKDNGGIKENTNTFSTSGDVDIDYGRILQSLKSDKGAIDLGRTSLNTPPENVGVQVSPAPRASSEANIISEGTIRPGSLKGTRCVTESMVDDEVASLSRKRKVSFHDEEHDITGSPLIDQDAKIVTKKALTNTPQGSDGKPEQASLVIGAKMKTGNLRNKRAQPTAPTTRRVKRKRRFRIVKLRRSNKKKVSKVESNGKTKTLSTNEHNSLVAEDTPNILCEDSPREDNSVSQRHVQQCDNIDENLEIEDASNIEFEGSPNQDNSDSPTEVHEQENVEFGHDVIHAHSEIPGDPLARESSGESSEDESSRLVSVGSINGPQKHASRRKKMKLALPPPLPSPTVSVSRQLVSKAFGLKTSRSGRLLVPPLAHWRNQSVLRDSDGGIIAIENGSEDGMKVDTGRFNFRPPVEPRARKLQKWLSVTATECFSKKFKSRYKLK